MQETVKIKCKIKYIKKINDSEHNFMASKINTLAMRPNLFSDEAIH